MKKQRIKEDRRFKQCNRELVYTFVFFIINILIIGGISLLAYGKPVDQISFIAGFPAWFFYGCLIGSLVLCVLTYLMVKFLFKDIPLDAYIEEEEE